MADDTTTTTDQAQQQIQVMIDDREMRTVYSNAYRIHTAPEEVVVEVGFNMANPNVQPGQNQPQQMVFRVTDRIIMSYANAKRLAGSLQQLVKRFEQQFGEIPVGPAQRK